MKTNNTKSNKKSKIQKIKARRDKAIELKRNLDKVDKEHQTFLKNAEKLESKQKTPEKRRAFNTFLEKENEVFEEKENEAYRKYYNHMNKDFDVNHHPRVNFCNYQDKFIDEKFINDIYKDEINSVKKGVKDECKSSKKK